MVNVYQFFCVTMPFTSNERYKRLYLKRCDQVPYFYISFDSQEAVENCKLSKFQFFEISKKTKFQKTY